MYRKTSVSDDDIRRAIELSPLSMNRAAAFTGLSYSRFRQRAIKLGVYAPNPGGKGVPSTRRETRHPNTFELEDILEGKHPQYDSPKLKRRLVKAGLKEDKCEQCGQGNEWHGLPLCIELHHVNGDSSDHRLDNIRLLCPNCHSQTNNFRAKNKLSNRQLAHAVEPEADNFEKLAQIHHCLFLPPDVGKTSGIRLTTGDP